MTRTLTWICLKWRKTWLETCPDSLHTYLTYYIFFDLGPDFGFISNELKLELKNSYTMRLDIDSNESKLFHGPGTLKTWFGLVLNDLRLQTYCDRLWTWLGTWLGTWVLNDVRTESKLLSQLKLGLNKLRLILTYWKFDLDGFDMTWHVDIDRLGTFSNESRLYHELDLLKTWLRLGLLKT